MFFTQVDLFSKSLLLVPIHLEVHWCLVTADIVNKRICLYDSQGNALQKVARVRQIFFFNMHKHLRCFPKSSSVFLYAAFTTEHPEILDNYGKGEASDSL